MTCATKMNWALSRRNRTDSASITTTRLSTLRIGWRKLITPMPPATAMAAAMKKTAIAKARSGWGSPSPLAGRGRGGGAGLQTCLDIRRQRLQQLLLGIDELLATGVGQLVLRPEHDRLHGTCILAVAAEDAAQHVDFVGLRVALAGGDAVFVGVLG